MNLGLVPLLFVLMVPVLLGLSGCDLLDNQITTNDIDPAGGLSRQDYLALRQRTAPDAAAEEPPIPALSADLQAPSAHADILTRKVSLTVTDSVPVREVLMELVRKTGANLELDPRVQGSVIIAARNQPFGQVLKRICALAGLRYTMEGDFIHIEPDDPFQKSYRLDYLSLSRRTSSETTISTNVFDIDVSNGSSSSSGGSGGGSGRSGSAAENNSTAKVSGVSEADFWSETEKSIGQILAAGDHAGGKASAKTGFSMNRQAGIITVYGNLRQQDSVEQFISQLRRKANAQVLIDARIIEVELDDTYKSGIDWVGVFKNSAGVAANFGPQAALNTPGFFTAGVSGANFSGLLNLVQTFGTTRVLSAPRITVLNNQTAVMKVATNQVYFVTQAQFTTTTNANGAAITTNPIYTSTPRTVPVGLVMTVQPSIDATDNRVTMTLRPTVSRVVGQVNDPSIGLNAAVAGVTTPVQSLIPVLAVREMDSVIQLHSGEIAVLGGLMQDSSINTDQGVPEFSDIPYIGNLFKSRDNHGKTSELVILLRATISDQPAPEFADANLYHTYNRDPRPLKLPNENPLLTPDDVDTEIDTDPTSKP